MESFQNVTEHSDRLSHIKTYKHLKSLTTFYSFGEMLTFSYEACLWGWVYVCWLPFVYLQRQERVLPDFNSLLLRFLSVYDQVSEAALPLKKNRIFEDVHCNTSLTLNLSQNFLCTSPSSYVNYERQYVSCKTWRIVINTEFKCLLWKEFQYEAVMKIHRITQ